MSNSSDVLDFDESAVYQFGIVTSGGLRVIGGGLEDYTAVRLFNNNNNTNDIQQWSVVNDNVTDAEYPYLLKLRRYGFYLDTHCDYQWGKDCSKGTVNRARLRQANGPSEVGPTGRWRVQDSGHNDNTYYWYNKANGTEARLDMIDSNVIAMTRNQSAGFGGDWRLVFAESVPAEPLPSSSSSSSGLSGGAIGGIVAGVVVGLLIIGAIIGVILLRRRKRTRQSRMVHNPTNMNEQDADLKSELPVSEYSSGYYDAPVHGKQDTTGVPQAELSGASNPSSELYSSPSTKTNSRPAELP